MKVEIMFQGQNSFTLYKINQEDLNDLNHYYKIIYSSLENYKFEELYKKEYILNKLAVSYGFYLLLLDKIKGRAVKIHSFLSRELISSIREENDLLFRKGEDLRKQGYLSLDRSLQILRSIYNNNKKNKKGVWIKPGISLIPMRAKYCPYNYLVEELEKIYKWKK